ncbi:MAG TPA: flagellar hook-basal body complex protein [Caldithrix sp.]|nr:flagellar hook-basal body complex protein [Caldithrix sp.]
MGLMRSLYAGVSGLRNHQVMMDVLGNNISNVNTIGFKAGRASFSETFAQTLRGTTQPISSLGGTNPMQVGLGMSLSTIDTLFGQGNIETTGQTTDLAIQGDGFFVVSDGTNRYYTRAGNFQFDANGTLIMPNSGVRVQGYLANEEGKIEAGSPLTDITLPFGKKISARATSHVTLAGNLDASAEAQGNILKTNAVYAVEDGDSDLEGLLATGNANAKITSLSSGTTEVKVSYGGTDHSYKYVTTDTTVGNTSFHTLNDLIAEINNDFSAAGLTASLTADGSLQFAGSAQVSVWSDHPNLLKAFQSLNGDLSLGNTTSDVFSHAARADDLLTNLRDKNGQSLGLVVGDEVNINGFRGGEALPAHSFTIAATSTYQDYATQISSALNLTNEKAVEINEDDGALKIHADGGKIYEITGLDIRADDTVGAGGTDRTAFNAIFDSSPGHYSELQKAEDVKQSASITVYDSLGNSFDITLIFTKDVTEPNRWKWETQVPEPASVNGEKNGFVEFNNDGSIKTFEFDDGSTTLQLNPGTGSDDLVNIELDPGTLGGFDGITQMAGPSTPVLITSQDGYGMGNLERITVDETGKISGAFSNGVVQLLGQITLASFNNPGGMMRVEGNLFGISGNSGDPIFSAAGEGISASIISGALEQSNVDLAEEFTKMIVAQRGFQANARIITTSDDMLQEVTNLKR